MEYFNNFVPSLRQDSQHFLFTNFVAGYDIIGVAMHKFLEHLLINTFNNIIIILYIVSITCDFLHKTWIN